MSINMTEAVNPFEDTTDDAVFNAVENPAPTPPTIQKTIIFDDPLKDYSHYLGERIDKVATQLWGDFSREQIKD